VPAVEVVEVDVDRLTDGDRRALVAFEQTMWAEYAPKEPALAEAEAVMNAMPYDGLDLEDSVIDADWVTQREPQQAQSPGGRLFKAAMIDRRADGLGGRCRRGVLQRSRH